MAGSLLNGLYGGGILDLSGRGGAASESESESESEGEKFVSLGFCFLGSGVSGEVQNGVVWRRKEEYLEGGDGEKERRMKRVGSRDLDLERKKDFSAMAFRWRNVERCDFWRNET